MDKCITFTPNYVLDILKQINSGVDVDMPIDWYTDNNESMLTVDLRKS